MARPSSGCGGQEFDLAQTHLLAFLSGRSPAGRPVAEEAQDQTSACALWRSSSLGRHVDFAGVADSLLADHSRSRRITQRRFLPLAREDRRSQVRLLHQRFLPEPVVPMDRPDIVGKISGRPVGRRPSDVVAAIAHDHEWNKSSRAAPARIGFGRTYGSIEYCWRPCEYCASATF